MEHHLADRGASVCLLCHKWWPCWGYARALEAALDTLVDDAAIVLEDLEPEFPTDPFVVTLRQHVAQARAVLQRGHPDAQRRYPPTQSTRATSRMKPSGDQPI